MRRRELIIAGIASLRVQGRAKSAPVKKIGFLNASDPVSFADRVNAFRNGVEAAGFVFGSNAVVEFRWANGKNESLSKMANELVAMNVDVIAAASGAPVAIAAQNATSTIPIVFQVGVDPVAFKLVRSLNSPGANLTGVTSLNIEVIPKRIEVLKKIIPGMRTISFLVDSSTPNSADRSSEIFAKAASFLGLTPLVVGVSSETEFESAFQHISSTSQSVVISTDPLFISHLEQLGQISNKSGVPAAGAYASFVKSGGLISYSGSFTEPYRLMGELVGRILNGDRPERLPVVQASKLELVINLGTARRMGLDLPAELVVQADGVIE